MKLTGSEIAQLIDLSAVKAENDDKYIESLVRSAKKYNVVAVFSLPSYIQYVHDLLGDDSNILLGGPVGFPSGGSTSDTKIREATELINIGCQELDMVINIGKLISGRYDEVLDDICGVVDTADGLPVKVILECHYLNDDQIRKACDLCIKAGAAWVKTGTGWAPTGATFHNVELIKFHVGDEIGIKAAGGIRDLETLLGMYRFGVRRFGVGLVSGKKILESVFSLPKKEVEF